MIKKIGQRNLQALEKLISLSKKFKRIRWLVRHLFSGFRSESPLAKPQGCDERADLYKGDYYKGFALDIGQILNKEKKMDRSRIVTIP